MPRVTVWQVNTGLTGGANHAAIHLHRALRDRGVDSRFLYAEGHAPDEAFVKCTAFPSRRERLSAALRKRWRQYGGFNPARYREGYFFMPIAPSRAAPPLGLPKPDLIHLHWIQNWIDFPNWPSWLPADVPVIWTLHDAYPFTGGCIFPWGCDKFRTQCDCCPQLEHGGRGDLASRDHARKSAGVGSWPRLHVVAPSRWLLGLARESSVFAHARSYRHIPYGLSVDDYPPQETALARRVLGIPEGDFVLCFGAASGWTDRRKGYACLEKALGLLAGRDIPGLRLLSFGPSGPPALPARVLQTHAGRLENRRLLSLVYSAADAVVVPSLEDNSPLIALEAMSSGVPVVALPAGGIPEVVRHRETGLVAADFSPEALAAVLRELSQTPGLRRSLGEAGRKVFLQEYSALGCAESYRSLYESALAEGSAGP